MASDGVNGGRESGPKVGSAGFFWVSSSPTPADIARLENAFPEVIQLPVEDLKSEMGEWHVRAILARSYQKWVPADAFVREFRRAGIRGEILPISLACRSHIFRFEDSETAELVLNRPWIINGQIIGMDRWKPEFVPAENAIPFALVWLRLPNLPLEFWKEDFLRAITEGAGQFHCLDAATMAKSRGNYARICLRMDLRRPLRPGTRVQGISLPFWQPFIYESLEGFCPSCGSLHLEGPCSVSTESSEKSVSPSPAFGPWLTAVRQRRESPGQKREERKNPQTNIGSKASSSCAHSQLNRMTQQLSAVEKDGWRQPVKVARRKLPPSMMKTTVTVQGSSDQGDDFQKGKEVISAPLNAAVSVPVTFCAGTVDPVNSQLKSELKGSNAVIQSKVQTIHNPFSSSGLGSTSGNSQGGEDAFLGPLKRARSVDCPAPRSISKLVKRKGKGKTSLPKSNEGALNSLAKMSLPSCIQEAGQGVSKPRTDTNVTLPMKESGENTVGPLSDTIPPDQSLPPVVPGVDSDGLMTEYPMITDSGTLGNGCLSDMAMVEDQGGVPVPPNL